VIGLVARKRAQRSKGDSLLGGNRLPWYLLGLSNASGMFDISGTMWLVHHSVCLRAQERMDSLAVPGFQSDLSDGVSVRVVRRSGATEGPGTI
jgi:hypothetical protein